MTPTKEHGSIGHNVKVHFAGTENVEFGYITHEAGANYFLFTVLPFIMDQFGIKWGRITFCKNMFPWIELPKLGKHVIMDSGLFSLMFGACKDVRPDEKFIRRYKDAICNFVNEMNLDSSIACVECDCQKLLGTELAWELREQMRKQIPNTIINVFHFEDGKRGLDRMIEFSDYIAISVPELRIVKPKTYKEDTYKLASYIKNKKPQIDIHLLGCTENQLLSRCKFATSADSTSWQSVNRFGRIAGHHVSQIKKEVRDREMHHVEHVLNLLNVELSEKRMEYMFNFYLEALLLLKDYNKYAGNQD